MGWRGTLRSLEAASRRAARDAERRHKAHLRELELIEAEETVLAYEEYLEKITTLHCDLEADVDWEELENADEPLAPTIDLSQFETANQNADNYKPNILVQLLGLTNQRSAKLRKKAADLKASAEAKYRNELECYEKDYSDWQSLRQIARRIKEGDPKSFLSGLEKVGTFGEIEGLGASLEFRIDEQNTFHVELDVHSDDIIPDTKYSLLKSGRLSEKNMPKGEFNSLYQDYVCSALLRATHEVFGLLPVKNVIATAQDMLVNSATGHLEKQPLVSAFIPRETLETIKLESVDPSDCFKNFVHTMKFKKTQGFEPVERPNAPEPSF